MIIANKTKKGFWIFAIYEFHLVSDNNDRLVSVEVDKKIWSRFNVGDYWDSHYLQFYKYKK